MAIRKLFGLNKVIASLHASAVARNAARKKPSHDLNMQRKTIFCHETDSLIDLIDKKTLAEDWHTHAQSGSTTSTTITGSPAFVRPSFQQHYSGMNHHHYEAIKIVDVVLETDNILLPMAKFATMKQQFAKTPFPLKRTCPCQQPHHYDTKTTSDTNIVYETDSVFDVTAKLAMIMRLLHHARRG